MGFCKKKAAFNDVQVMHFKMNPNEIARNEDKEMIEDLKKENTKLKCKVKEMQQGHEVSMCESKLNGLYSSSNIAVILLSFDVVCSHL